MELYFRDNFFNAGRTDIVNARREPAGTLDLKSAFGSSLDVLDLKRESCLQRKVPVHVNQMGGDGGGRKPAGRAETPSQFHVEKFIYESEGRGIYEIFSPAFFKEYSITDERGLAVAQFEKVNGWFESGAFCLRNESERLGSYELIAVVMGVHETNKRMSNAHHANIP